MLRRALGVLVLLLAGSCDSEPVAVAPATDAPSAAKPSAATMTARPAPAPPESHCRDTIPVFADGRRAAQICADDAAPAGLTVIDLTDRWAPFLFKEDPSQGPKGKQPYLATYRALAAETFGKGPKWQQMREDRYFELYGIPPTFRILRDRISDDARHECHDAVDDDALIGLEAIVREEYPQQAYKRRNQLRATRWELNAGLKRFKLDSYEQLAKKNAYYKSVFHRYQRLRTIIGAIIAAQEHLACDGFKLTKHNRGIYTWATANAVGAFQREHMFMADDELGAETRAGFRTDSRELDFRATLRALRERVVDATGLIEDGSAREDYGKVLGRYLDSGSFRVPTGHKPLKNGAPDLISKATEAAARALGWTSVAGVRSFFSEYASEGPVDMRVAVRLPPVPAYHSAHMDLHAVVDRGDVRYDPPRAYWGGCFAYPAKHKPTMTLYARDNGREIALVRWHTTIGGWNKERKGGWVGLKYKNSDVGKKKWRYLIASPAWYPFKSEPDRELVRKGWHGVRLKYEVFGPSYRSAYGLVMLIHHEKVKLPHQKAYWWDNGIRTHGSANFKSIVKGCSHGCHRLYNHQSMRLGSFLLRHRKHIRQGPIKKPYQRIVRAFGHVLKLELEDRGYRYELTPPIEVEVLEGNVHGYNKKPIKYMIPIPRPHVTKK